MEPVGLESAFGALQTVLPTEVIISKLTSGRSVLGLPEVTVSEGQQANLTLFNPEGNWTFEASNLLSKSKNSAFLGSNMQGKVYGIYNQQQLELQ